MCIDVIVISDRPRLALKHYIEEKKELENDLHRKAFNIFRSGEKLDSAFGKKCSWFKNPKSRLNRFRLAINNLKINYDYFFSTSWFAEKCSECG